MPKLTIDGREVEVTAGTTVIKAAAEAGVTVPNYCWHPGLTVAGNCRICLVEIEKMPKLAIACSTVAADGMVVRTMNQRVHEARDAIMEFLLINHPLDCPICDQAGECRLQEYSYRYGPGRSRFVEEKVHKPKKIDIGPHIVFDAERCILCTRCVRFCQEVTKTHELTVAERGDHAIIETFPGRSLDNAYSGNTVDICPVGALTLKEFRFRTRVWFLKNTPSVCPSCARGCSIVIGSKDAGPQDAGSRNHRIFRYVPRENHLVNRWWMCDEGRLSFQKLEGARRITSPAVRPRDGAKGVLPAPVESHGAGRLVPLQALWGPVLDEAAARLRAIRDGHGPGRLAMLVTPRATNEDLALAALVARDVLGRPPVYIARHERGEDDEILIRRDKSPNERGARAIFATVLGAGKSDEAVFAGTAEELGGAIRSETVRGLLMIGHTIMGYEPGEVLASDDLARLEALVLLDSFEGAASAVAGVVLPTLAFGEFEGTFTNFLGHVQRVRAALPPHADAWPAWRILQELGRRLGGELQFSGPQAVFASLAGERGAFSGLSYAALGELGATLPQP